MTHIKQQKFFLARQGQWMHFLRLSRVCDMSHRMQCKHRSQYFTIPTRRREHSDYMELTLGGNDD